MTSRDRALIASSARCSPWTSSTRRPRSTYLIARSGRAGDEPAARELGDVARRPAARAVTRRGVLPERHELRRVPRPAERAARARALRQAIPRLSYAQTVASTWKVSMRSRPRGRHRWPASCSRWPPHLAPDAIPQVALRSPWRHRRQPAPASAWLTRFNALARFSLATVEDDTMSVHRLLQKTVRDDIGGPRRTSPARSLALAAVRDAFPVEVWRTGELADRASCSSSTRLRSRTRRPWTR